MADGGYPGRKTLTRIRSGGGGAPVATNGYSGRAIIARIHGQGASRPSPKKRSGGGGFLHELGRVGHVIGQKTELAARDIKGIPGGTIDIVNRGAVQPWKDFLTTGHVSTKTNQGIDRLISQQSDAVEHTLNHPGEDPFATLALLSPALHGAGRVGVGGVEATRALKAGKGVTAAVKAAKTRPEQIPRALKVGDKQVPLIPSRNAAVRVGQAVYDKTLQRGLDKNPEGRVAAHAQKRVGGALKEEAGIQQRMRAVPASLLDKAAGKLAKAPGRRREQQAALELTSVQTTAEEAAAYHRGQAAKGVNPARNEAVAKLYDRVARRGLVHLDETKPAGEKVFINPENAALAKADAALARVQSRGDQILAEKNVRPAEALQARTDAPGRVRAGATYEKPTPAKQGVVSQTLKRERVRLVSLERRHQDALAREADWIGKRKTQIAEAAGRTGGKSVALDNPFRERIVTLGHAIDEQKTRVAQIESRAAARVKPTGIVGGASARPGRGFVSARISDKLLSKAEASASRGPVVGAAKSPIDSKTFTGRSIEQGLIPKHVTASASRHFRQILRFVNTDATRRAALETGSDLRRSSRDILVRKPDETAKPLTPEMLQALGKETSAIDTTQELAAAEGLRAAHQMFVDHLLGRDDPAAESTNYSIGAKAPDGYRWVDQNALGDLTKAPAGPRGRIGRTIDSTNSAVTAMTVYFKIGHVGTRVLTNASTNIIQGSAGPRQVKKSYQLWDALDEEQRGRALAAAGQHGFSSLPHEGTNLVARIAGRGAQWWAKHADAMFRFNSLAYELRKIGYSTPEAFTRALDQLESGGQGMAAHDWSKLSAAARRADREAISYDRLNEFERRYITRAIWFYPWIKGSTLFTVRTALEHPYKTGLLGEAGVQGRKDQEQQLGPTPSYEAGLVKLFGGGNNPGVADFSTFSPFATAGDVIAAPGQPGSLAGFFNPAAGAAGQFAYGLNRYGGPSKEPLVDARLALGAATPEQQLAEAYAARGQDQSGRMFPKTPLSVLTRFVGGPAVPRRVNKAALAKAAARERSGRR